MMGGGAPDHPAAPTASRCNQWRAFPEAARGRWVLRHQTLMNRERESGNPRRGDRGWRRSDDKDIITAAAAPPSYSRPITLGSSCFSPRDCFTFRVPRGTGRMIYIEKTIYNMSMGLMWESHFLSLLLVMRVRRAQWPTMIPVHFYKLTYYDEMGNFMFTP